MKVFIYTKRGSEKMQEFNNVTCVKFDKENHKIVIEYDDEFFGHQENEFNTKLFKAVIYQN